MKNIEIVEENDQTVILFNGRIDTNTAPVVEEEISKANLKAHIIIDAKNLEYISSSGLRVVLRLARRYPDLKVINTSNDIYEVFEVTGFTDMLNIQK